MVDLRNKNVCFIKSVKVLPVCSMDKASRDTEIFSSEVLTQSSMPLQPLMGKVKLELVVVGRLWMIITEGQKLGDRGLVNIT